MAPIGRILLTDCVYFSSYFRLAKQVSKKVADIILPAVKRFCVKLLFHKKPLVAESYYSEVTSLSPVKLL